MEIRNIAIIAHVDHGKTTLTDALLKQSGMVEEGFTMDINKLEQERGITIYSKNTSLFYPSIHSTSAQDGEQGRTTSSESSQATTKINIVDTPGHADFGSEVERVLRAIDSVLLVVDAGEGPMPQTRFVLKKSLELGLKPIVVINKIDKPAARPEKVHEEILELFLELGANEEQLDFKTIYAIGRQGIAKRNLSDQSTNLNPLLDLILDEVPSASTKTENNFVAQVFNLAYDNFLGRLAIARIYGGKIKSSEQIFVKKAITNETRKAKITKLFTFEGMSRKDVPEVSAGDIVIIAGIPDIYIGETITSNENEIALPSIAIDEPTISLNFLVNDSPFAGQDGKFVTSRQIKERLEKELEVNVGLKVEFSAFGGKVSGRGELHIAVLLENMRREGYELQVSQPQVIIKETDGKKFEPYEEVIIDVPEETSGAVIEKITKRRGVMQEMNKKEGIMHLRFEMPTRGLLGYKSQFIIDTKGEGILSSRVIGFEPHAGEIKKKEVGSMTSMEKGTAVAFALDNLQNRGVIYIEPGTKVYEGMVIGNVLKGDEMAVNPTKGKQLTNVRASGTDEAIFLKPAYLLTIERGLEIMAGDEYLEVTPKNVRLRKKFLTERDRAKAVR